MGTTFQRLYRASFKGVEFLMTGEVRTSGGRRTIDHVYPNSDRRFIEDVGKLRKDFTITGIIKGPRYIERKKKLIDKLEEEKEGIFSHPFFGNFIVKAKPYELIESLTTVNIGTFQMTFSVVDKNIYPNEAAKSKIGKFLSDLQDSINDFISGEFVTDFVENFSPAVGLVGDAVDAIDALQNTQAVLADQIDAFNESLVSFRNNINTYVKNSASLAIGMQTLFDNAANIVENPLSSFDMFTGLFGFSRAPRVAFSSSTIFGLNSLDDDGDVKLMPTVIETDINTSQLQPLTAQRIENNNNVNVINIVMNLQGLGESYSAAADATYNNNLELDNITSQLEDQYFSIVGILDDDLLEPLQNLRDEFRKFRDLEAVNVDKVIEFDTKEMPMTVLSYMLYGSTDNEEQLLELNDSNNPTEIEGTIKVLST